MDDTSVTDAGNGGDRLASLTHRDLGTPTQVGERFLRIFLDSPHYHRALMELLQADPSLAKDFSLEIDMTELSQRDPELGIVLLRCPSTLLRLLEDVIVEAQNAVKSKAESQMLSDLAPQPHPMNLTVKGEKGSRSGDAANITPNRIHARLTHLLPHPTHCKPSISRLNATDTNKIIQIAGTVTRTSGVCMYESARSYQCCDQKSGCGGATKFRIYADMQQHNNALPKPTMCPGQDSDGNPCGSNKFVELEDMSVHTDYQEIKIQESRGQSGGSRTGSAPRSLLVKCQHDLVNRCQPGDEVVVVGTLISQWQPLVAGQGGDAGVALDANSIRVVNAEDSPSVSWSGTLLASNRATRNGQTLLENFEEYWASPYAKAHPIAARNKICRSVCPRLYGMSTIKLALLVTLIGGGAQDNTATHDRSTESEDDGSSNTILGEADDATGTDNRPKQFKTSFHTLHKDRRKSKSVQTRRRDQSHMLLVGDPGTGKSQFLRFAAALCPRSVMTTGTGTTSAGLTCAAVREGNQGEYQLEAGALVLADKGVCCIDEFGCIRSEERTAIHEAMEQQTLSVAKAGIVAKLNCRATVIAVTNAKGGLYDHGKTLTENTGIESPLMSRFDLVFRLVDEGDSIRDEKVATFLLNKAIVGPSCHSSTPNGTTESTQGDYWSMEKLRIYIATVQSRFRPAVNNEAVKLLKAHYQACRASMSQTTSITVRFLESLIRLSQAHARLMYRSQVTLHDAAAAILLMECSAGCLGGIEQSRAPFTTDDDYRPLYRDPMVTIFPDDDVADIEFLCDEYILLDRYDMVFRLSEEERETAAAHLRKHRRSPGDQDRPNPNEVDENNNVRVQDDDTEDGNGGGGANQDGGGLATGGEGNRRNTTRGAHRNAGHQDKSLVRGRSATISEYAYGNFIQPSATTTQCPPTGIERTELTAQRPIARPRGNASQRICNTGQGICPEPNSPNPSSFPWTSPPPHRLPASDEIVGFAKPPWTPHSNINESPKRRRRTAD